MLPPRRDPPPGRVCSLIPGFGVKLSAIILAGPTTTVLRYLPSHLSWFCLIQNVVVVAVLFIFYGLYQGIFRAVGKAFATDFVPEHLRASGVGWYNTTVGVAGLVASIVAGLLWDHISHSAVFLYGAVFAAAGCIALLILFPTRRG